MNVASQKHELRQAMKATLRGMPLSERQECGIKVREHVATWLDEVLPNTPLSVGLFASLPDEICTRDLDQHLALRCAQRAVACADRCDELFFYHLADHETVQSVQWRHAARHEHAPRRAFNVIFVPGLAFDPTGNRLGRGRGCFDRGLKEMSTEELRPLLVGLLFDEQLVAEVPCLPHDIAVDYLCTPKRGMLKAPTRVSHA